MPDYVATAREALEKYKTEQMNGHLHPKNGAARAEGPNQKRLEEEMTLISLALANNRMLVDAQQKLQSIEEQLNKLLAERASPGPLFDKPVQPAPDPTPEGGFYTRWLNWKPTPKPSTPLAALDLTDAAKNAIQGLPFPVNSVEDLTSRVRTVDIQAVKFAGKFTIKDIKQSLQTGGYPPLLPDDYAPPPRPDGIDFKLALEMIHDVEKGLTVDHLATKHDLPVARVIALLDQTGPLWNENPHHVAYWAKGMGWRPPEQPKKESGKKTQSADPT